MPLSKEEILDASMVSAYYGYEDFKEKLFTAMDEYAKQEVEKAAQEKEGLVKALEEIESIVLRYDKLYGDSPAANHCRNIAMEALAAYQSSSNQK